MSRGLYAAYESQGVSPPWLSAWLPEGVNYYNSVHGPGRRAFGLWKERCHRLPCCSMAREDTYVGPIEPLRLLQLWQAYHQPLTEEQQRKFLSRAELRTLCSMDELIVIDAIRHQPKLAKALEIALDVVATLDIARDTLDSEIARKVDAANEARAQDAKRRAETKRKKEAETKRKNALNREAARRAFDLQASFERQRVASKCKSCDRFPDIQGRCGCS